MPIITSLLDIDFYKLTMAQVAWKHFPGTQVKYEFTNRTKRISLTEALSQKELYRELENAARLRFRPEEIRYLRQSPHTKELFEDGFLRFLADLKIPPVTVAKDGERLVVETQGKWPEAIFWETIILAVVNELYQRALVGKNGITWRQAHHEGSNRLHKKIETLRKHPEIRFAEFGTRRRFSGAWQKLVTETLRKNLRSQLVGTSNVLLAKELGLSPVGTYAHEMDMVCSGIFHGSDDQIRFSHQKMLAIWWEQYGERLSIALADTYGSDFFFKDFTREQAKTWRGLRQDSGDPITFGETAIAYYRSHNIDPRTKTIVFSDGLDVDAMVKIADRFAGRIQTVFGWGTNLTNDVGLPPLSIVVKATEANGHKTVKLSDNLAKATGTPADIERFKRIFGYAGGILQPTIY